MPVVDLTVIFDGIQDRKFRLKTGRYSGQPINPLVSLMGNTSLSNWSESMWSGRCHDFESPSFSLQPLDTFCYTYFATRSPENVA